MKLSSKIFFILLLFIFFILSVLYGCFSKTYNKTIEDYISLTKQENFKEIYDTLLDGPAKERFKTYTDELAKDEEMYNAVIQQYKLIKKITILQTELFPNNEIAVKFQFIDKNGMVIDTPWWRFKKSEDRYRIIKFSKY